MNKLVKIIRRPDLIVFIICVSVFLLFPKLDLTVSNLFYREGGFFLAEHPLAKAIYWIFAKIQALYLLVLIGLSVYFAKIKKFLELRASGFCLAVLLLGPGLIVNVGFKDNSLGRPRPVHIMEFGGKDTFTPVFHYSGACTKNCSFVSGHAALGFYGICLFWIFRKKRWLLSSLALGTVVSFVRIIQGGHFLSDVIFAAWTVYFCCLALRPLLLKPIKHS
ncbi:MAG: lipid A 4'-phosphatase [Flavobacteriales bacterium]|jgi:lipid A 4'-phosphatase